MLDYRARRNIGQPRLFFSSWKREKRNIEEDEKEGNPAPEKRQKMTKVYPGLVEKDIEAEIRSETEERAENE